MFKQEMTGGGGGDGDLKLTVCLSSSSFDGGGFLLVLAGFSWISGGLVLRPSWGV